MGCKALSDQTTIEISQSNRISPIWIVPIIALLIGLWLGAKELSEKGPVITIAFNDAAGIAVEKTEIRYKDVKIGKVTNLRLSKNLKTVYVTAEMDDDIEPHLSVNSRFWVVHPQISINRVSGLSTLFSGVYIAMDPGEEGEYISEFTGLEQPPSIHSDTPGSQFILRSQRLGSVNPGSPIYYREISVGEVTSYKIDENDGWIEINIFIPAPYDRWVNKHSRFWNVSGFRLDIGADGITAETGPLTSLLLGGIAFDEGPIVNMPAEEKSYFYLYPNYDAVIEGNFTLKHPYVLHFKESVRGLKIGSPVEYKGIKVGKVTQIELHSQNEHSEFGVNVYINVQPQRFDSVRLVKREVMNKEIEAMIKRGLRAQLKTSSLVTGSLYVDLIENVKEEGLVLADTSIPSIPTIPGQYEQLARQLTAITNKIDQFPLNDIGEELKTSLISVRKILSEIEKNDTAEHINELVLDMQQTSKNLTNTLNNTDQLIQSTTTMINPDSELHYQLLRMMEEVRKAARSIETLTTTLHRKPESVIYGKGDAQ